MSELVEVDTDGPILMIGVNRVAKRNAWNREIIGAVGDAYERLRDDDALRVGVVWAHGEHFSAGLDLPDVLPALAGAGDTGELMDPGQPDPWGFLGDPCPKPVVVAAQGRCYTLGIELILASQAAVVAEDTIFAQLEVARGIIPLGGGGHRLPGLAKRGMQWLLTAETFDARAAFEVGMVSEVVPTGTQLERALEIAGQIAANAPLAVRAALANSRAAHRAADDAAAAHVREAGGALFTSEDAMEAVAAMTERRDPDFTGR
jgi:enoyl-CoA hydratase/carnithine racemase